MFITRERLHCDRYLRAFITRRAGRPAVNLKCYCTTRRDSDLPSQDTLTTAIRDHPRPQDVTSRDHARSPDGARRHGRLGDARGPPSRARRLPSRRIRARPPREARDAVPAARPGPPHPVPPPPRPGPGPAHAEARRGPAAEPALASKRAASPDTPPRTPPFLSGGPEPRTPTAGRAHGWG